MLLLDHGLLLKFMFNEIGLFITCKVEDFSSILVSRFCYSVCLSVGWSLDYPYSQVFRLSVCLYVMDSSGGQSPNFNET